MAWTLSGPVTAEEADEIAAELRGLIDQSPSDRVEIECGGMSIDGAGVRMLAAVDAYARRAGRILVLVNVPDRSRRKIEAVGQSLTMEKT